MARSNRTISFVEVNKKIIQNKCRWHSHGVYSGFKRLPIYFSYTIFSTRIGCCSCCHNTWWQIIKIFKLYKWFFLFSVGHIWQLSSLSLSFGMKIQRQSLLMRSLNPHARVNGVYWDRLAYEIIITDLDDSSIQPTNQPTNNSAIDRSIDVEHKWNWHSDAIVR